MTRRNMASVRVAMTAVGAEVARRSRDLWWRHVAGRSRRL